MAYLWGAVGILLTIVVILSIKLCGMQKAATELSTAFADRLTTDTNVLIDLSCGDRSMRRLASALNKQLAVFRNERHRFQQGDSELKEAVTNISHDLRTPLTAICGYLDLLETEEKSEIVARYFDRIRNRTEALKVLTEELFRYSVIVSVNETANEKLMLNRVLEESLLSFYNAMQSQGVSPEILLPKTQVERTLNRSALSRIFDNILTNAVKYSDGDLTVVMRENGTITFSNTAKALTAVEVGKLFNRFFTVESGRNSTGLGLSIAKLLTERLGGTIQAAYENDKLSITLEFPAQ